MVINLSDKGKGQGIILLHGWGQNMQMMKGIQDYFVNTNRVINLDLPGFGNSEEPDTAWSTEDYADQIHELCVSLKIEKPIIIAHSFGARVAFRYAIKYPVHKMVLTGAAGIRKPRNFMYYVKVYVYKISKKLSLSVSQGSTDFQNASGVMRGVLVNAVNEDITPLLKNIDTETLLVFGERDDQTPLWMGKKMEENMPNATLITLAKDDHFAYFHQIERFNKIVEIFLKGEA